MSTRVSRRRARVPMVLGTVVVLACLMVSRDYFLAKWFEHVALSSAPDERRRAVRKLGELGSGWAVPALLSVAERSDELDGELDGELFDALARIFPGVGDGLKRRIVAELIETGTGPAGDGRDPGLEPLLRLVGHTDAVHRVEYRPDGKVMATASRDATARLYDAATGKPRSPPLVHGDKVYALAFSPNGKLVATGSKDGTARLWDSDTGAVHCPPMEHVGWVCSLAFSPDSSLLLSATVYGLTSGLCGAPFRLSKFFLMAVYIPAAAAAVLLLGFGLRELGVAVPWKPPLLEGSVWLLAVEVWLAYFLLTCLSFCVGRALVGGLSRWRRAAT